MPTMRDVAKHAKVSVTTVSRILTNDSTLKVTQETKDRVFLAIRELNYDYQPKRKQLNIGVIMSLTYDYSDPYFSRILNGIQSYCTKNNAVIAMIISYNQIRDMKGGLENRMRELDGIIVTDVPSNRLDYLNQFNENIVCVDNYVAGFINVGYDIVAANRDLMGHLIDSGFKKIAYIGGPGESPQFERSLRMIVIREELRHANIDFDESLIYNCEWDPKICAQQVDDLIDSHPDVQAIFAGSDSLATVIIHALNKHNLRCPQDIAVVGFNDNDVSRNFTPPITTIRLPAKEMGEMAARVLIDLIHNQTYDEMQILLPYELKVRESSRRSKSTIAYQKPE